MKLYGTKISGKRNKPLVPNGIGLGEGRDLEAQCFNLAQMPNRITND